MQGLAVLNPYDRCVFYGAYLVSRYVGARQCRAPTCVPHAWR